MNHLDIGCGTNPRNPNEAEHLFGVDQASFGDPRIKQCRIGLEALPFSDNFFDSVSAYDLLEHIPRQSMDHQNGIIFFPFIYLMQDIWRVLKPGGTFTALTPSYPSKQAFQDPTHVNFITADTHSYFCGPDKHTGRYGFTGDFSPLDVREVLPEEIYGDVSIRFKWRRFRYKFLKGGLTHIYWNLRANK